MNSRGQADLSPALIRMLVIIFALAGVGAGLMLKQVVGGRVPEPAPLFTSTSPGRAGPRTTLAAASETGPLRLAAVEAFPPPDPFVATSAPRPVGPAAPAPSRVAGSPASPGSGGVTAAAAAPAPEAQRPVPALPEDLTVTGIVAGESPLVVVQTGGRTLFLKIGDQVADSWQLDSIGDRSVVFRADKQQVTLPIQGGGSE